MQVRVRPCLSVLVRLLPLGRDQSPNPLTTPPPTNCFTCHNTSTKNPQPVHVTHSITNAADLRACPWTTPPPACQATQPEKVTAQTSAIQPVASH